MPAVWSWARLAITKAPLRMFRRAATGLLARGGSLLQAGAAAQTELLQGWVAGRVTGLALRVCEPPMAPPVMPRGGYFRGSGCSDGATMVVRSAIAGAAAKFTPLCLFAAAAAAAAATQRCRPSSLPALSAGAGSSSRSG